MRRAGSTDGCPRRDDGTNVAISGYGTGVPLEYTSEPVQDDPEGDRFQYKMILKMAAGAGTSRRHQAARSARHAPGLRPAPVRRPGARDGRVEREGGRWCYWKGHGPAGRAYRASPIRPLAVAATDNGRWRCERAAGHQAARSACPTPGGAGPRPRRSRWATSNRGIGRWGFVERAWPQSRSRQTAR